VRSSSFRLAVIEKFRGLLNVSRALGSGIDLEIARDSLNDLADLRRSGWIVFIHFYSG
jgi:hypothetical protein